MLCLLRTKTIFISDDNCDDATPSLVWRRLQSASLPYVSKQLEASVMLLPSFTYFFCLHSKYFCCIIWKTYYYCCLIDNVIIVFRIKFIIIFGPRCPSTTAGQSTDFACRSSLMEPGSRSYVPVFMWHYQFWYTYVLLRLTD